MAHDVIQLRVTHRPTCADCREALFGLGGVYCRLFQEDIHNEHVAVECEEFEPNPSGEAEIIGLTDRRR